MSIHTPDWVKHAVFYQIFPDRFAHSSRTKSVPGTQLKPWGTPPEEQGFQGGNLAGIVDKLDYLTELGITALYLNPIFSSASNHRYHTFDFFQVDPLLGGNEALRELLDEAHQRNIRVILDGVFNHASRGFWAFHHILEAGGNSPYLDWFIVRDWPLRPYTSNKKNPPNYDCWWNLPALPKFNIKNPGVRDYLLRVARYWIEFGADGWRLDVPEEIDDVEFWQQFREGVKTANPEAYICGEIWHQAQAWLQGDRFDAVMNYIFSRTVMGFFGADTLRTDQKPGGYALESLDAPAFAQQIERMYRLYDWEVNYVQLNLLDSHDTARALWLMQDDVTALKLSVLFQMTTPGAPCIYYGDEIGMSSPGDPHCRAAFPWHDESEWNHGLLDFYRRATQLRHQYPVLRLGDFKTVLAEDGIYAFSRRLEGTEAIVIFNTTSQAISLNLPLTHPPQTDQVYRGVWLGEDYTVQQGFLSELTVPAREGCILICGE